MHSGHLLLTLKTTYPGYQGRPFNHVFYIEVLRRAAGRLERRPNGNPQVAPPPERIPETARAQRAETS